MLSVKIRMQMMYPDFFMPKHAREVASGRFYVSKYTINIASVRICVSQ